MYQRIVNDELYFPPFLSEAAADLLGRMLARDPEARIGAKGGIRKIREHPFFEGINWEDVLAKRIKPPFTIDLGTSYFDTVFTSSPINWSEGDDTAIERERSQSNFELVSGVSPTEWTSETENDDARGNSCSLLQKKRANREQYVKSIVWNGEQECEKRPKTDRNRFNVELIPKVALELFQGYSFSKHASAKAMTHPGNDAILIFKACSVKTKSAAGESNDPGDDVLFGWDEEDDSRNESSEGAAHLRPQLIERAWSGDGHDTSNVSHFSWMIPGK
jgi:serine/threonine protein kinase